MERICHLLIQVKPSPDFGEICFVDLATAKKSGKEIWKRNLAKKSGKEISPKSKISRFGHSLVPSKFQRVRGQITVGHYFLKNTFFKLIFGFLVIIIMIKTDLFCY